MLKFTFFWSGICLNLRVIMICRVPCSGGPDPMTPTVRTPARVCDGPVVAHAHAPTPCSSYGRLCSTRPTHLRLLPPLSSPPRTRPYHLCPMSCVCNGRGLALSLSSSSLDRLLVHRRRRHRALCDIFHFHLVYIYRL